MSAADTVAVRGTILRQLEPAREWDESDGAKLYTVEIAGRRVAVRADEIVPYTAWLPIARADRSFVAMHRLGRVTIRNSAEHWVRDAVGAAAYRAVWTEGTTRQGAVWWAIEAETVCRPLEFLPHPLDHDRLLRSAA